MTIPEPDWKQLRRLKDAALDRFCRRVLNEFASLTSAEGKSNHERYLELFQRVESRDRELADTFDGLSRSTAILRLARMRALDLITDEEFERFSPDTRRSVELLLG